MPDSFHDYRNGQDERPSEIPEAMENGSWWEGSLLEGEFSTESKEQIAQSKGEPKCPSEDLLSIVGSIHPPFQTNLPKSPTYCPASPSACSSTIRKQRRREFHKIHTQRSRAKLNERMEMLKSKLPQSCAGRVIKSKAQIIDQAVCVLDNFISEKVYEKMEVLRQLLPEPREPVQLSSLAQLLDFTIYVLDQLQPSK